MRNNHGRIDLRPEAVPAPQGAHPGTTGGAGGGAAGDHYAPGGGEIQPLAEACHGHRPCDGGAHRGAFPLRLNEKPEAA